MFMKRVLVLFLVILLVGVVSAQEYYVSNEGDDDNDGLSDATAWATIGKVNSYTNFQEGDDIYFRCGDNWTASSTSDSWSWDVGIDLIHPRAVRTLPHLVPSHAERSTCERLRASRPSTDAEQASHLDWSDRRCFSAQQCVFLFVKCFAVRT